METLNSANLTTGEAAAAGALLGGALGTVVVAGIAITIIAIIAMWKIFTKAGEKGWKSLVPIYNAYILFKISGIKAWFWAYIVVVLGICIFSGVLSATGNMEVVENEFGTQLVPVDGIAPIYGAVSACVGIFEIVVIIMLCYKLSKAFKRGIGTTIGLIFLPFIFTLILAFGSAKYDKKVLKK